MNDIRYCTSYDHAITPPFLLVDNRCPNVESQSITIVISYRTPYNNPPYLLVDSRCLNVESQSITIALSYRTPYNNQLYLLLTVDVPIYDRNL